MESVNSLWWHFWSTENWFNLDPANDWIRTCREWYKKWPLCKNCDTATPDHLLITVRFSTCICKWKCGQFPVLFAFKALHLCFLHLQSSFMLYLPLYYEKEDRFGPYLKYLKYIYFSWRFLTVFSILFRSVFGIFKRRFLNFVLILISKNSSEEKAFARRLCKLIKFLEKKCQGGAEWPDLVIFESFWWHFVVQKQPKCIKAILKTSIFK